MKAIILAGGLGTRLSALSCSTPKPLIRVGEKPVLQYQIENLKRYGITDIILVIGHLGYKIKEYFQEGRHLGVKISYFEEEEPLGTAGAFYHLRDRIGEECLVLYGDLIFDIHFKRFFDFHKSKGGMGTLIVHPNDHPNDSDLFVVDKESCIRKILKKNILREGYYSNCVNAGILLLKKEAFSSLQRKKQDLEKDVIEPLLSSGNIFAYKTSEYLKDMGTPERYRLVEEHLAKGIVAKRNSEHWQKAIFLDRDGTLNKYRGFVTALEELELEDGAASALQMINCSEYLSIIITNQSVIARNLTSVEVLEKIHQKLETVLGEKGAYFDDIFYCPHHPDRGYPEENKEYKIACSCRKPQIGLLELAKEKYHIDLSSSYFIGDQESDVQTGKNAKMKTVLLGEKEQGAKPDYLAKNLLEAVSNILEGEGLWSSHKLHYV